MEHISKGAQMQEEDKRFAQLPEWIKKARLNDTSVRTWTHYYITGRCSLEKMLSGLAEIQTLTVAAWKSEVLRLHEKASLIVFAPEPRLLDLGEAMQEGDEYQADGVWWPVPPAGFGFKVEESNNGFVRRPFKIEKVAPRKEDDLPM